MESKSNMDSKSNMESIQAAAVNPSLSIPTTTNANFPPTEDNPLGGLYVVYDETLDDIQIPTLYAQSARLKSSIVKAKTIEEIKNTFAEFDKKKLACVLNYINSPIIDFLFKNKGASSIQDIFYLASENGHLEIVKYLVSLGADVRALDNYAVRYASENGHLETVKYLTSVGAVLLSIFRR